MFKWYLEINNSIQKHGYAHDITPDNLVVFENINRLLKNPMFLEETREIELLKEKIMLTNYSWRDTLRLLKNRIHLEFALVDDVHCFFEPIKPLSPSVIDQSNEINHIKKTMATMCEVGTKEFGSIFEKSSQNYIEEYIRRMFISQLDILKMIESHEKIDYFLSDYADTYYEDIVKDVALDVSKNDTEYCTITRNMLFYAPEASLDYDYFKETEHRRMNDSCRNSKSIINGIIESFNVPVEMLNLREMSEKIQRGYGLSGPLMFIGENNRNFISLTSGEKMFSVYDFEIPFLFRKWQGLYELLYQKGTTEEFVNGCTYIMCEMVTSQMFISGNKRTAKALFNSMLCSRGIVPPIVDMLEDNHNFFKEIVIGRELHYQNVIDMVFEEAINTWDQFDLQKFNKNLTISPNYLIHQYVPNFYLD